MYKKILLYTSMFLCVCFSSCEKEERNVLSNQQNESKIAASNEREAEMQIVPFFEVKSGDTIPKGIFRDKPLFEGVKM